MQKRIEICGGIAAGKTTLAGVMEKAGYTAVYERFEDNPFLGQFYKNSLVDSTFETEIVFALLHYNQIRQNQLEDIVVSDYSMLQDYSYGMQNLSDAGKNIFEDMHRYLSEMLAPASLIIYLKCGAECLYERIRKRSRDMEMTITKEYLQQHIKVLEHYLDREESILIIDSERYDFRGPDQEKVLGMIEAQIAGS